MESKSQKVVLEKATAEELPFIIKGVKEICKIEKQKSEDSALLRKTIRKAIEEKKIIVAKVDDSLVGFLQFAFSNKEPYGLDYGKRRKFCWIEWMYVARPFRKKEIGHSMHKELIKLCKAKGIKEIMVDVFEVNKKARAFYEREAFSNFIHILRERV